MVLATFNVRMDENLKEQLSPTRESGYDAFLSLRKAAKENGVQDLTLDEINDEINAARRDKCCQQPLKSSPFCNCGK